MTYVSGIKVVKEPHVFQELLLERGQLFLTIGLQAEPNCSWGFCISTYIHHEDMRYVGLGRLILYSDENCAVCKYALLAWGDCLKSS